MLEALTKDKDISEILNETKKTLLNTHCRGGGVGCLLGSSNRMAEKNL